MIQISLRTLGVFGTFMNFYPKKAEGKTLGRKKGQKVKSKLDGKEEAIKDYLAKDIPLATIAKIFDVGRTTLSNFVKSRKLKEE